MKYITCIFLNDEITKPEPSPMIGVQYQTIESGLEYIDKYLKEGIQDFLIFTSTKNKSIDYACEQGVVKEFIEKSKEKFGDKVIIHADVGLSPYTEDGNSVVMSGEGIDYDETYRLIRKLAVTFSESGADYVCPVIPFDDQVEYIKEQLKKVGLEKVKVHSYSAKFSSALYGPYFKSVQAEGKNSKRNYYIDNEDSSTALDKIKNFEKQGADIVMVKPALFYLDIVYRSRQLTKLPLSVYHVSGEYSMIKEAAKAGIVDEEEAFDEVHSAFQRCGADYVIGYAPDHFLRWNN